MLSCLSLLWQAPAVAAFPLLPAASAQEPAATPSTLTPAALADLLDNPEARQALIDQLRSQAAGDKQAPAGNAPSRAAPAKPVPATPSEPSLQERMADGVQRFLTGIAADMGQGVDDLRALASGQNLRMDSGEARSALLPLAMAVIATIIAFILLRMIAMRIYTRIDHWVAEQGCESGLPPARGKPASMKVLARRAGAIIGA
ncbi:mechanosensitive ion channel protein, partial [Achromobacter sp. KAs 3-5]